MLKRHPWTGKAAVFNLMYIFSPLKTLQVYLEIPDGESLAETLHHKVFISMFLRNNAYSFQSLFLLMIELIGFCTFLNSSHVENFTVKENLFRTFDLAGSCICDLLERYLFLLCCLPFSSSISFSGTEVCYF